MRCKRTSLRRWKARCRIGRLIPAIVIVQHRLDRWFVFERAAVNIDASIAVMERRHG